MTIGEANDVNVLLSHIYRRGIKARRTQAEVPALFDMHRASRALAARSYKALYAGWTPEDVDRAVALAKTKRAKGAA